MLTEKETIRAKSWLEYDIPRQIRLTYIFLMCAIVAFAVVILIGPQFFKPQVYALGVFGGFVAMLLLKVRLRVLEIMRLLQAYVHENYVRK